MDENSDTIKLALANRQFLYQLIARCFSEEADGALVGALTSEHTLKELLLVPPIDEVKCATTKLQSLINHYGDEIVTAARTEYAHVFLGPGALPSSPWESVHITGKNLLFQPQTLNVRDSYRSAGFLPMRYPAVADDHIALELDFLANVATKARNSFDENDRAACIQSLSIHRQFLDDHLLVWIDEYRNELAQDGMSDFYAAASSLAAAIAKRDRSLLDELLDVVVK